MIKDSLVFVAFILLIGGVHYGLSSVADTLVFSDSVILGYAVLIIMSLIGSNVFLMERKLQDISFPQAFLIVTVVQMLGAMSFAAYLRYTVKDNMRTIVLQFVAEFLLFLTFQSVYLIKTKVHNK